MSGARKEQYIGRYLIEDVLGEGAMGIVYKGFDRAIKRHVAIKTIHGALLLKDEGHEFMERFKREAQAAGRLIHPNVVTVFEYGHHEETPYLVLEFIPGCELREIMDEGPMELGVARGIFQQMLSGMGVAHAAGIVHRDIKPQNIFVMPDGLTKVGDFGIARIDATGFTRTGTILGTPSYMSPEQFTGAHLDQRSDLYAAAAVLYEMLTGVKVFTGKTVTEVMYAVLEKAPPRVDSLSPAIPSILADVVTKGLAKNPDDRYQNADEFRAAFEAACGDVSIGARKPKRAPGESFAATPELTAVALHSCELGISEYEIDLAMLIARRCKSALTPAASELLQQTAVNSLGYDGLIQFLKGLEEESEPRLAVFTLASELSRRDYETSEATRLATMAKNLANATTMTYEFKTTHEFKTLT